MKKLSELAELDRIKTKDGRIGTVMLIMQTSENDIGLCIEFDDAAPETETIDLNKVAEIILN